MRDFGRYRSVAELERYEQATLLLLHLNVDVAIVQEVRDVGAFVELAEAVGMRCGPSAVALDPGRRLHGMGVMWKPRVEVVPHSVRVYDLLPLHHGMAQIQVDVGQGEPLTVASTHLTPWGVYRRDDEARNIAGVMRRYSRVVIGADWNCVSDARRPSGKHYDADPFAHLPWSPKLLGKCRFDEETGKHLGRPAADGVANPGWAGGCGGLGEGAVGSHGGLLVRGWHQ
jgi:hypothetical protein